MVPERLVSDESNGGEEHLVEAATLVSDQSQVARLHFAVSPQHLDAMSDSAIDKKLKQTTSGLTAAAIRLAITSVDSPGAKSICTRPKPTPFMAPTVSSNSNVTVPPGCKDGDFPDGDRDLRSYRGDTTLQILESAGYKVSEFRNSLDCMEHLSQETPKLSPQRCTPAALETS